MTFGGDLGLRWGGEGPGVINLNSANQRAQLMSVLDCVTATYVRMYVYLYKEAMRVVYVCTYIRTYVHTGAGPMTNRAYVSTYFREDYTMTGAGLRKSIGVQM